MIRDLRWRWLTVGAVIRPRAYVLNQNRCCDLDQGMVWRF